MSNIKAVAILTLSAIGELILALPLLNETLQRYPKAKITLLCQRAAVADFARQWQVADDVVLLPSDRRSPLSLLRALRVMRELRADILLQTFASHGSFGNLLVGASAAPVRCGFAEGRLQTNLTHCIPVEHQHHIVLNLNLLRRLGHFDIQEPVGPFLPNAAAQLAETLRNQKRYTNPIVVSVGSDPILFFKRWPAPLWSRLCQRLHQDQKTCLFVGHSSERPLVDQIIAGSGAGVNLAGKTDFLQLAALIQVSQCVIGTDGMSLHLASALGKPCVGLFGPTDPKIVGPWGQGHEVINLKLPCSPCYGPETVGKAIACRTYECLSFISTEMVYQKARKVLGRRELTLC